ncbi:MAG: hypothetical protein M1826_001877 [Phylliscum demangeonii]|nr:MAG: hypothetical protein M1826_001877 [Phylliscum demangeonii]
MMSFGFRGLLESIKNMPNPDAVSSYMTTILRETRVHPQPAERTDEDLRAMLMSDLAFNDTNQIEPTVYIASQEEDPPLDANNGPVAEVVGETIHHQDTEHTTVLHELEDAQNAITPHEPEVTDQAAATAPQETEVAEAVNQEIVFSEAEGARDEAQKVLVNDEENPGIEEAGVPATEILTNTPPQSPRSPAGEESLNISPVRVTPALDNSHSRVISDASTALNSEAGPSTLAVNAEADTTTLNVAVVADGPSATGSTPHVHFSETEEEIIPSWLFPETPEPHSENAELRPEQYPLPPSDDEASEEEAEETNLKLLAAKHRRESQARDNSTLYWRNRCVAAEGKGKQNQKSYIAELADAISQRQQTGRQLAEAQVGIQSLREQLAAAPPLNEFRRLQDDSQKLLALLMVAPRPEELEQLKAQVQQLLTQLAVAPREEELNGLRAQVQLLTAQLAEARDEGKVKVLQELLSSLEQEVAHLRAGCNRQEAERQEYQRMLATSHSANMELRRSLLSRNGKIRDLKEAISQAGPRRVAELEDKIRRLEEQTKTAKDRSAAMAMERVHYSRNDQRLAEAVQGFHDAVAENAKHQKVGLRRAQRLRELEAQNYAVALRAEEILADKHKLRQELEDLKLENYSAKGEIEALTAVRTAVGKLERAEGPVPAGGLQDARREIRALEAELKMSRYAQQQLMLDHERTKKELAEAQAKCDDANIDAVEDSLIKKTERLRRAENEVKEHQEREKKLRADVHEAKRSSYPLKEERDCLVYAKDVMASQLRQAMEDNRKLSQDKQLLEHKHSALMREVAQNTVPPEELFARLGDHVTRLSEDLADSLALSEEADQMRHEAEEEKVGLLVRCKSLEEQVAAEQASHDQVTEELAALDLKQLEESLDTIDDYEELQALRPRFAQQTEQIAEYKRLLESRNDEMLKLVFSRADDPLMIQTAWKKLGDKALEATQQAQQMQVQLVRTTRAREVERGELDYAMESREYLLQGRRDLIIRLREAEEGWEKFHRLRTQPLGRPAAQPDTLDNAANAAKLQTELGRYRQMANIQGVIINELEHELGEVRLAPASARRIVLTQPLDTSRFSDEEDFYPDPQAPRPGQEQTGGRAHRGGFEEEQADEGAIDQLEGNGHMVMTWNANQSSHGSGESGSEQPPKRRPTLQPPVSTAI